MNTLSRQKNSLFDRLLSLIEVRTPSDKLILRLLFFIVIFSGIWVVYTLNEAYSSDSPIHGGVLKEGIVGTPRFINPALAITRADQDVAALVYGSLLKIGPDGTLVPDIAESITTSQDGLTYNIIIRKDIRFHDGTPLTARDVIYTIELIQNPDLKSPLRGNWSDVTVEEIGEYELNVVLKDPYAPFNENFLLGILPAHLFEAVPIEQLPFSQLNTEPIGSGPFSVVSANRDPSGLIESYTLEAFRDNPSAPNIDTLELHFFTDEAELIRQLKENLIDSSAYVSNKNLAELNSDGKFQVISQPLPRVFGIFFNQNKSAALRDPAVREALDTSLARAEIVEKTMFGYGVPITGPVATDGDTIESVEGSKATTTDAQPAISLLTEAGWLKNNLGLLEKQVDGTAETLSFTLKTSNTPLFNEISEIVVEDWKAIGVDVAIEQFEQTDLVQSVIRPRDFEALLFGLDMNRSGDLYPFWHSSQKDDPGLNIAQYTNVTVDTLLQSTRTEQDVSKREQVQREAGVLIQSERPALFLFKPRMTYVVAEGIIVGPMTAIAKPSDRFSNIDTWYTDSDTLWNIFKD